MVQGIFLIFKRIPYPARSGYVLHCSNKIHRCVLLPLKSFLLDELGFPGPELLLFHFSGYPNYDVMTCYRNLISLCTRRTNRIYTAEQLGSIQQNPIGPLNGFPIKLPVYRYAQQFSQIILGSVDPNTSLHYSPVLSHLIALYTTPSPA